ncbi:MAG: cell division protein FtsK [Planctomycetia bacterium]|nr:cell division protein FtsK [Planctomycetia bacterium]
MTDNSQIPTSHPVETRLTLDHYRALLDELHSAAAERSRILQELADLGPLEHEAGGAPSSALTAACARYREELAAVDEQHTARRQALDDRFAAETAAATAAYDESAELISRTAADELERIEKKYQEDCWLMSSILDDKSDASPQRQLEKLEAQVQQGRSRLAAQDAEVSTLAAEVADLAARRHLRIGPEPEPSAPPSGRDAVLEAASAAAQIARDQTQRMARQARSRLLVRRNFVIVGALLWFGLSAGIFAGVSPQWLGLPASPGVEWPLIAGGLGFGLTCVILLILHVIASNEAVRACETIQQAVVDARAHARRWHELARREMQVCEAEYRTRQAAVSERREKSLQQFGAKRQQQTAAIQSGCTADLLAASRRRDEALAAASDRHNGDLLAAESSHRRDATGLRTRHEREQALQARQDGRDASERNLRRRELANRCEAIWCDALAWFETEATALAEESRRLFPDWQALARPEWQAAESIPPGVRIGDYAVNEAAAPVPAREGSPAEPQIELPRLPAVLPFPGTPSLLLKAAGPAGRAQAVAILQTAMLRLLTELPPGDLRFTIVDAVGLGENFAAFMHLADYDDLLISGRIWTEQAHIEQQLANLTEHMENVFQKYLRNEFETIEDYNVHAGEVAEPYRVLIVANFPAAFSERAAQRLVSIVASGPRCGVHTLIGIDTRQTMPRGFDLAQLEGIASVLEWDGLRFLNRAIGSEPLALIPDELPAPALWAALIRKMGELSKHIRRVEVPFHRIVPRDEAWWTEDSRYQIDVPLGRAGATKLQHLRLGPGTSQHVLVAGKTGSGKSTLLHVIVVNLALRYSPDEVEFYLIDFKKGVEFKTYATHRLPHACVISIESDREFGVSTLERLDAILKERGDLFRSHGVQDIASYRNACPDARLPRILLMVDEFQEFFVEDDRYSQTAALLLDRLVRQGRAFGIHVLLGSQTLGGAYSLARTTIGQMAVRIALQCSDADAHLILSENNSAARLLTRPGEAIYNDANGMLEGNNPFQVAWLDDEQRDGYLARIGSLAEEQNRPRTEAIVFEGNIPADPSRNPLLGHLIESATRPAPETGANLLPQAWLGDAVAITGPTMVAFSRRSGANLLVVGADEGAAAGMLQTAVVALAIQCLEPAPAEPVDGARQVPPRLHLFLEGTGATGRWSRLLEALSSLIAVSDAGESARSLAAIAAEVARRRDERAPSPPLFLVVDDLSRFRDLRKSDDDFGFSSAGRDKGPTPGQAFAEILREGPAVGVHAIVWCDSYNNVDRWFSRQTLREFEMRVVLQMSGPDSSHLIDSPAAARLGTNRALLYSDERGTLEKFRPYGLPEHDWLSWVRQELGLAKSAEPAVADDIDQWLVT